MNTRFLQRIITASLLIAGFTGCYLFLPAWVLSGAFVLIGTIIILTEWPKIGSLFFAPLYPTVPFILLITLNQIASFRHLVIVTVVLAAAFDTGAYLTGTLFGKHKITPISPNKSWEGLLGGILSVGLATFTLFWFYHIPSRPLFFFCFVIATATAAFFGDLFVSWLKRRAHIKDSGALLPGHGGLLDRFDSIMFIVVLIFLLRAHLLIH